MITIIAKNWTWLKYLKINELQMKKKLQGYSWSFLEYWLIILKIDK